MDKRYCRRCGTAIPFGKKRGALYCSARCRRAASNARVNGAVPDDEDTEAGRLEVQWRLATALRVDSRCRCSNPIGLVDEDGAATCFRCGWPLALDHTSRSATAVLQLDQGGRVPPAA